MPINVIASSATNENQEEAGLFIPALSTTMARKKLTFFEEQFPGVELLLMPGQESSMTILVKVIMPHIKGIIKHTEPLRKDQTDTTKES